MPPLEHAEALADPLTAPMHGWALAALDLVFPAVCPVCGSTLGPRRRDPLCGPCWDSVARITRPCCERCGVALRTFGPPSGDATPVCGHCLAEPPAWDWARAAAEYEGVVRDAIHAFKFEGKRALARPLADLVAEQWAPAIDADVALVAVPLARSRERERGFNQAALLAERLAAAVGRPRRLHWLARVRATGPQSDLGAAERRANVRGAFAADPAVRGHHVVLVDDVLTTGATAAECARALRAAGAARVGVLTVARVR